MDVSIGQYMDATTDYWMYPPFTSQIVFDVTWPSEGLAQTLADVIYAH